MTPRTEAGRALLRDIATWGPPESATVRVNLAPGYIDGIEAEARQQEREYQVSVRKDWGTLPHGEFHAKYGNLAQKLYLLPTNCSCRECQMWSS